MNKLFVYLRRIVYMVFFQIDNLFRRKNKLFVLCYHSIASDDWLFSTKFSEFERQMEYLHNNYNFITPEDFENIILNHKNVSVPSVLLTLDDGYKNNLEITKVLNKYNIKPIIFILADRSKVKRDQISSNLEFLSDDEIIKLRNNGWVIGSHSLMHRDFDKLNKNSQKMEIDLSKNILESIVKRKVKYFSYPKGKTCKSVIQEVKKSGYKLAFSMGDELITKNTDEYSIPRVGINNSMSFLEFKASFSPSVIKIRKILKKYLNGLYE